VKASPVLDSIVLPWLLLTVALLGGVRLTEAAELRFVVPPLASLLPGRQHALRALFVAFFAAFAVKFIVLDGLYAPGSSLAGRLITGLLEGVTLGSFDHVVWGPATGYLVFLAVALYFLALTLMPRGPQSTEMTPIRVATDITVVEERR
jgi:hypothetical protein